MNHTTRNPDTTLTLVRRFTAPPERVFDAFVDPKQLRRWFAPDGFEFEAIRTDPKTGLPVSFVMVGTASAARYAFDLLFEVVDRPQRIRWCSVWGAGFPEPGRRTTVTIEFRDTGEGTEITLVQEGFDDRETRDEHGRGWGGGLQKLVRLLG